MGILHRWIISVGVAPNPQRKGFLDVDFGCRPFPNMLKQSL